MILRSHTWCIPHYAECRYAAPNAQLIAIKTLHDNVFDEMLIDGIVYASNDGDQFRLLWGATLLQQPKSLVGIVIRAAF